MVLNKIKSEAPAKIKRYVKNMERGAVKASRRGRGSIFSTPIPSRVMNMKGVRPVTLRARVRACVRAWTFAFRFRFLAYYGVAFRSKTNPAYSLPRTLEIMCFLCFN